MEAAIKRVRDAIEASDTEAIKSATNDLEQASTAFTKTLFEKAGATSAGGPEDAAKPTEDDAIDAEFEVKDK